VTVWQYETSNRVGGMSVSLSARIRELTSMADRFTIAAVSEGDLENLLILGDNVLKST
jgi:hypothetical protein